MEDKSEITDHVPRSFYDTPAWMVSMVIRIDLGSSRRGDEIMELYRLDVEERKGFELVDY